MLRHNYLRQRFIRPDIISNYKVGWLGRVSSGKSQSHSIEVTLTISISVCIVADKLWVAVVEEEHSTSHGINSRRVQQCVNMETDPLGSFVNN